MQFKSLKELVGYSNVRVEGYMKILLARLLTGKAVSSKIVCNLKVEMRMEFTQMSELKAFKKRKAGNVFSFH